MKIIKKDWQFNLYGGLTANLEVYLEAEIGGNISLNFSLNNTLGIQYYNNSFYIIRTCEPSFNMEVGASVDAGIKLQLGLYWMKGLFDLVSGGETKPIYNVSTKWGIHADATYNIRNDKYTSYETLRCLDILAYLYGNINLGKGSIIGNDSFFVKEFTIFDSKNSPLKLALHFENGKKIDECSYEKAKKEDGDVIKDGIYYKTRYEFYNALLNLINNNILPDGSYFDTYEDESVDDSESNKYTICDIDNDGREELILDLIVFNYQEISPKLNEIQMYE